MSRVLTVVGLWIIAAMLVLQTYLTFQEHELAADRACIADFVSPRLVADIEDRWVQESFDLQREWCDWNEPM